MLLVIFDPIPVTRKRKDTFCIYSVKSPQYSVPEVVGSAEIITIEGCFSCFSVSLLICWT